MRKIFILTILIAEMCLSCNTQKSAISLIWTAKWISPVDSGLTKYGVYLFRNSIELSEVPANFIVQVSADSRYRLFVNGIPAGFGPARGDLKHWNYETIDIAKFLKTGKNIVSAQVFNWGQEKPVAQITSKTAFILQAPEKFQELLNTGSASWKVSRDSGYSQIKLEWWKWAHGWYAVGGSDEFTASKHPWGWENAEFNDTHWQAAKAITDSAEIAWRLIPRNIPMLEETIQRFPAIRESQGIEADNSFLTGKGSFAIPANTRVSFILDMQKYSIGFPELLISKGMNSVIKITYAESPFTPQNTKPNRNEIKGNKILGPYDIVHPDGGDKRMFRPLWFRAFRYVQLEITTERNELILNDYYQRFSAYPFELKARFESSDSTLKNIWDVSWRTARCDAFETYMDCPYYEQLNYEGDSRIQALISLYMTGDDRLMRNSILHFSHSMMPSGILQAAYPFQNKEPINIPTYSLYFINMLHDYYMCRPDTAFLRQFLPDVESILNWYDTKKDSTGLLGALPNWNYVDWSYEGLDDKTGKKGQSGVISLICADAMKDAADLYLLFGEKSRAKKWEESAAKFKIAVNNLCFDSKRKLYSDTPDKLLFSEHMNCLAILTDAISPEKQNALMKQVMVDTSLIKCSTYFQFYYFLALKKAGMGDQFIQNLGLWRNMLAAGLTTFSETGKTEKDRSDCHAWSAHPGMEMLSVVAGITPAAPGYSKIRIQPSFNKLEWFRASMPHPKGVIEVDMKKTKTGYSGTITIPLKVEGELIWKGKTTLLKEGKQEIVL